MWACNARTRFSHPPADFYEWGECIRVCVLKSSSVWTLPHPIFENVITQCENTVFASTTWFLWVRRVCESICFKSWFSPDGPAYFWKCYHAMRENRFRIHHLIFMSEKSVSEYVLKGCSVQTVPHPIFENVIMHCEKTGFAPTTWLLWVRRMSQRMCFKKLFSPGGPAPNFFRRCDHAMREHRFRIHQLIFVSEESGSGYVFKSSSVRSRTLFLKKWWCNARTKFSHPPADFYEWGECVRVYVLQTNQSGRSRILFLKTWPCNVRA